MLDFCHVMKPAYLGDLLGYMFHSSTNCIQCLFPSKLSILDFFLGGGRVSSNYTVSFNSSVIQITISMCVMLTGAIHISILTLNKSPTRCNSMQSDFFRCKVTLHVSGVTAPIIRSTKNCNHSLRYWS